MRGQKCLCGFTLVEIMIVVVIIGLLASMAIPGFFASRKSSQASVLANDLRTYAAAFEIFATENGSWPPDANHGEIPLGMEDQLPKFTEPTVVGGNYDWEGGVMDVTAGISIVGSSISDATAERLDHILDDGSLASGKFFLNGARYTYVLQR